MEYLLILYPILGAGVVVWAFVSTRKDKSCINCRFMQSAGLYGDIDDHCSRLERPCGDGCKGVYFIKR